MPKCKILGQLGVMFSISIAKIKRCYQKLAKSLHYSTRVFSSFFIKNYPFCKVAYFLYKTRRWEKVMSRNELIFTWQFFLALPESCFFSKHFNHILPGLWKDVVTQGGMAIMVPLFFWLWGHQKSKTEPWHIFGTKNYLKSHFEPF